MDKKKILYAILGLAVLGILFSGYLTYYTYSTGQAGCELFFAGMPSCFYGLIMYIVIFILALMLSARKTTRNIKTVLLTAISLIGIGFAAYLTMTTLSAVSCTKFEIFGIPPCVYGLAMYTVLLIVAAFELRNRM